ncbi:uncharacterized protein LOC141856812 [Brevipalpus obovatus]|uniref:uncharacterized protein LOC141856812 n=1 Tax=Brevipalpus obovatus TaxID=246614 RepID=UPI003D9EEACF
MMSKFHLCATALFFTLFGTIFCDLSSEEISEAVKKVDQSRPPLASILHKVANYCYNKGNIEEFRRANMVESSVIMGEIGHRKAIKSAYSLWSLCRKGERL